MAYRCVLAQDDLVWFTVRNFLKRFNIPFLKDVITTDLFLITTLDVIVELAMMLKIHPNKRCGTMRQKWRNGPFKDAEYAEVREEVWLRETKRKLVLLILFRRPWRRSRPRGCRVWRKRWQIMTPFSTNFSSTDIRVFLPRFSIIIAPASCTTPPMYAVPYLKRSSNSGVFHSFINVRFYRYFE